jgi:N-acetylmuramoyl-L-alanine amidase
MKHYVAVAILISVLIVPWMIVNYPKQTDQFLSIAHTVEDQLASVILARKPKTVEEIKARYIPSSPKKVRILIVPGHEPSYGGAEYPGLKERNLNIEISESLEKLLKANGRYEVVMTRTAAGWNPAFDTYFRQEMDNIISWKKTAQAETAHLLSIGKMELVPPPVFHNDAPTDVAHRLYGITKWANENDVDIAIHVHVNDYPGHPWGVPGEHNGIAIYVPDSQLGNSSTTIAIASSVFKRLNRYNPVSTLSGEKKGIIEEPELIAVGVNNTSVAPSMLIEYGYLYEPQYTNADIREEAVNDLAFQTYLGLQDFFGSGNDVTRSYDTLTLPRTFNRHMSKTGYTSDDAFALQSALILEGAYPPSPKTMNDCPRTGKFGPCTIEALEKFQKKYGIYDEVGFVGIRTLNILNKLYSGRATSTAQISVKQ